MKIRDRLSLDLALTVLLTVAALGLFIYFFTADFHKKEFFQRLDERVQITEKIFLENNEAVEQAVREKFLQTLDEEREYAITLKDSGLDSLNNLFYQGLAKDIQENEVVQFWQGDRQGVGRFYRLPKGDFAVVVTAVDVFGQTKLRFLRQVLLIGVALCVLILVAVSRFSTSRALKPLESKIRKASSIGANQLDLRLEVNNPDDEIGALAIAFNKMLDRLQAAFEAQKQFVSNASHEIRNPLTAIIGETELLLEKTRSVGEYQEALQVIGSEAGRLEILTRQLLDLAKAESLTTLIQPEEVPLDLILLEVLEKFPPGRLRLTPFIEDKFRLVDGNGHLLYTALANLAENALKYSGDQPVDVQLTDYQSFFEIVMVDRGFGIPAKDLPNIFQPLHRGRNARGIRGHGIGLALSKKIIELHNGTIEIESEEGKGTKVTVRLPIRVAIP